jgi:phosphoglycerol transferase
VTATLFVFLPYHFARGLGGHLFLSTYYSVPLGALLALSVLLGEPVFERGERSGRVGQWASRRTFLSLGMCIVIGSCGLYYAFFTDLLLALAAGLTLAVRRRSDAIASCVALAVIACTVALTFVPNLAYRAIHGPNPAVAHRVPFESEVFATKLTHLVLPVPGDRISPLRRLRVRYDSTSPPPQDYGSALGLIGAAGVFVMIVTLLLSALPQAANVRRRLRATSLLGVFTILVITVGGISSLIAYVVTPQIRAWYRDSIFVGFFALLAVALLLERILRGRSRWVVLGVVGLLLAFGLFEQTTDNSIPTYASARAEYDSDAVLVREIESRLPDRGSVFQLPYIAFPEAASVGAADVYAGGRGYLHSHDLRWSWGSIEGRREDWQAALAGRPVGAVIRAVAAAGFDGLWLDRDGFPASWPALERRVTRLTGAVPLVSPDRHISFFDLRRFRARERSALGQKRVRALRAATLEPVSTIWSPSFYDADLTAGGSRRWSASSLAQVMLESPAGAIRVAFAALASSKRPGVLTVAWPDGTHTRVAVSQTPVPLRHRFAVPGRSGPPATITFTTTATPVRDEAGTRTLYFALDDAAVTPVFPR